MLAHGAAAKQGAILALSSRVLSVYHQATRMRNVMAAIHGHV